MEKELRTVKFLEEKIISMDDFNSLKCFFQKVDNESFFNHSMNMEMIKDEFISNPFSIIYGYYVNNKLVAYLDYWITFDSATIFRIAVSSEYQKQGIATELMNKMFEQCKTSDVFMITLEVRESNLKAYNLYTKLGFNKISVKPDYYENHESAIYMGKGI